MTQAVSEVSRRRMVRLMMRRLVPWWTTRQMKEGEALVVVNTSNARQLQEMADWREFQAWSQWWMQPMKGGVDCAVFLLLDMRHGGRRHHFALGFSMRQQWDWLQSLSRSLVLYLAFSVETPIVGETVRSLAVPVSDSLRMLLIGATKKEF